MTMLFITFYQPIGLVCSISVYKIQYFKIFRQDWDAEAIKLRTSIVEMNGNVAYPTVTICSTFAYDRWGFLRDLLNQAKFLCNGQEDCEDTV